MADEGVYELEPDDGAKQDAAQGGAPTGGSSMGSARGSKPGPVAPGAKIEAGGLLDDFDEDADFSDAGSGGGGGAVSSPAVEHGRRSAMEAAAALLPAMVTDASVMPVVGNPKILGVVGGVLLLLAVIVTAVTTTSARPLIPPLIALYEGIVHTGTGVVAVLIAARFGERRVNRLDLVAARMLVLVSAFLAIKNLNIPIPGRIEEYLLAGGVYYLGVLGLFRLPRFETGLIAGTHFCLWVLMMIGRIMYGVVEAAGVARPVGATGG